jgi:hypothetical protein
LGAQPTEVVGAPHFGAFDYVSQLFSKLSGCGNGQLSASLVRPLAMHRPVRAHAPLGVPKDRFSFSTC